MSATAAVWLLGHYPDCAEADARVDKTVDLTRGNELPIWLFATATPRYPASIEAMLRDKLVARGISAERILCSADVGGCQSFETAQELSAILSHARRNSVEQIICVSNRLHLLQVGLLARDVKDIELSFEPSCLREWRWWYLAARIGLVPLAYLGPNFGPLSWVRHARAHWEGFHF